MNDETRTRLDSFFANPERCRQDYYEAWALGKAAYDAFRENDEIVDRLSKEEKHLDNLRNNLSNILADGEPLTDERIQNLATENRDDLRTTANKLHAVKAAFEEYVSLVKSENKKAKTIAGKALKITVL